MEKNTCVLLLLTCLLGIISRPALATHARESGPETKTASEATKQAVNETPKATPKTESVAEVAEEERSEKSGREETQKQADGKEPRTNPFPVGHRIEVQVQHGVYVVERAAGTPDVLTISLQLPDGSTQQFGFVPVQEVITMLEEAESLGSGLPEALLDAKFLSYAFAQEETAVEVSKPDIVTTTKLAQEFIEAEAQAEEHGRTDGKTQNEDDEDVEEEEEEEGDEEDGEEDEDENHTEPMEGSLRGSRS